MSRNEGVVGPTEESVLDSWKEIAAYLDRSVRTVQTWENKEGLPVHRHQHRRGGTVYAYPLEIDAWKRGRAQLGRKAPKTAVWGLGRWWIPVVALALVAGLAWRLADRLPRPGSAWSAPSLGFDDRDRLLIAGFENTTGDGVLDGTLETALARDLTSQGFAGLVSRQRLADTLQLLGRPLDTPVDAALAQELALQDRAIRAVLFGSIEPLDSGYLLSLDLLDPLSGEMVTRFTEEAANQEEILPAVRRLSRAVRASVGAASPAPERPPGLTEVSTPSLRALQLLSRADRLFVERNLGGSLRDEEAAALLREAIVEDPAFATAHIHLAWALNRRFAPAADYLPHAETALELAGGASVPERYFIQGSHLHMKAEGSGDLADMEAALVQYRALLELDPDHFWALENSIVLLQFLGRGQEALELSLRALDARPNHVPSLSRVAEHVVTVTGDLEEATPYVQRARELLAALPAEKRRPDTFLEFFPEHQAWARGDIETVLAEADRIVYSIGSLAGAESKGLAERAIATYLDFGLFAKAEALQELYSILPPRAWRYKMGWRREHPEVVRELTLWRAQGDQMTTLALAAADLAMLDYPDDGEAVLARVRGEVDPVPGLVSTARGTIAFDRGHYDDAIVHLRRAVAALRYSRYTMGYYFWSVRTLSRALEAVGETERGLEVLERASRDRERVLDARLRWMELQLRLAEAYRAVGRVEEAVEIEDELRRYCAYADRDFPILRELENRGRLAEL